MLAVDGVPTVSYLKFDVAAMNAFNEKRDFSLTICRDHVVQEVRIKPVPLSCSGTKRIITFGGIQMQDTHAAVLFNGYAPDFVDPEKLPGVYISSISRGSPAETFGINPVTWLAEIESEPVRTLDDVIAKITNFQHGEFVRLTMLDLEGEESIATLQIDLHFWVSTQLVYDDATGEWKLTEIKHVSSAS